MMTFFVISCQAQNKESKKITWMSFEDAVIASEKNPKKIYIDVYTSWCGWCKKMDATTFMDDSVAAYMEKNFYCVKLDAERKDTIHFRDKIFAYQPDYKCNEIALSLLSGKMSYPSFVFMDEKFSLLTVVQSYLTPPQLMPILKYFGDNIYISKTWEDYQKEITN
jgi:thioredoxin-related protein